MVVLLIARPASAAVVPANNTDAPLATPVLAPGPTAPTALSATLALPGPIVPPSVAPPGPPAGPGILPPPTAPAAAVLPGPLTPAPLAPPAPAGVAVMPSTANTNTLRIHGISARDILNNHNTTRRAQWEVFPGMKGLILSFNPGYTPTGAAACVPLLQQAIRSILHLAQDPRCKGNLKMAAQRRASRGAGLAEGESKDMNKTNYNT
ncbi:hypothetical protein PLEOSDRAFT_1104992 [Pleurotus ostreatus PC15]|uniref:Uncharacterized protein n=1 Tax=Pleurotus ostreatus (strain PC15) TaxID=1137138 RepID=A0A067NW41_PLEO1|nr:hypothetical protein PLEOSDRAFT_1104992 [Pleurotus ostreatus PC15]